MCLTFSTCHGYRFLSTVPRLTQLRMARRRCLTVRMGTSSISRTIWWMLARTGSRRQHKDMVENLEADAVSKGTEYLSTNLKEHIKEFWKLAFWGRNVRQPVLRTPYFYVKLYYYRVASSHDQLLLATTSSPATMVKNRFMSLKSRTTGCPDFELLLLHCCGEQRTRRLTLRVSL
jgi:hypothetical protein